MIDRARKNGPVLVFDSGNALFKYPGVVDDKQTARAAFILRKMGALETKAMAVGNRDLNAGPVWLAKTAKEAHVEPLSVNLVGADKKPAFKGSTVVNAAGLRLGFIGVTAPGTYGELTAGPTLEPVKAEAAKLKGKADVVLVLAAVSFADAMQLSNELKDSVDFIVQSSDSRGIGIPQKGPGNFVLPSGERGRHVGQLDLTVTGKGRFEDQVEADQAATRVRILDEQLRQVHQRLEATKDPAAKAEMQKMEKQFEQRRAQALADSKVQKTGGRAFRLQFVGLGSDVPDDPVWIKEVDAIDPPGTRGH